MPSTASNLLGSYVGKTSALESVVDAILPLLNADQKEKLANAITALTVDLPEDTPENERYDPEYSQAMFGVYQGLLVELWRPD